MNKALLLSALLLVASVATMPLAAADHTDAHNSSKEVGSTVYSFVPLIVLLFMLGIAIAALSGFAYGRRHKG